MLPLYLKARETVALSSAQSEIEVPGLSLSTESFVRVRGRRADFAGMWLRASTGASADFLEGGTDYNFTLLQVNGGNATASGASSSRMTLAEDVQLGAGVEPFVSIDITVRPEERLLVVDVHSTDEQSEEAAICSASGLVRGSVFPVNGLQILGRTDTDDPVDFLAGTTVDVYEVVA